MKHQNLGCAFVNDIVPHIMAPMYESWGGDGGLKYYIDKLDDNFIVKLGPHEKFFTIPMFPFSIDSEKFNEKSNQWPQWWLKSPAHGFPAEINEALETLILFLCKTTNKKLKAKIFHQACIDAQYILDPLTTDNYIGALYYNKDDENIISKILLENTHDQIEYILSLRSHPISNFPKNHFGFTLDPEYFGVLAIKDEKTFGVACTDNFVLVELE